MSYNTNIIRDHLSFFHLNSIMSCLGSLSKKLVYCCNIFILFFTICLCEPAFSQIYKPEIISSDSTGVTLELSVGNFSVNMKEIDGRNYHLISYNDCSYTSEVGKPLLPIFPATIGIPPNASIAINLIDTQFSEIGGYLPYPVPKKVIKSSDFSSNIDGANNRIESLVDSFTIDDRFYGKNVVYPSETVSLSYQGYIRNQRIASLEFHPIQYNPATRMLRKYKKIIAKVNFTTNKSAPYYSAALKPDKEFESLYKGLLLNYESAKSWRASGKSPSRAPSLPQVESSPFDAIAKEQNAIKVFVSKSGIYKMDYDTLQQTGTDLSKIDPRTFKLYFKGSQISIYVHGENDGRFDPGDYIEFYGTKPESIYTRWNVYWLAYSGEKGSRMVQKSGIPSSTTATEVTFFKSRVRFEEDHLHHKLQNVRSDPDDPESWFESRDHWFWTGIENGSAKNEAKISFPVYDPAQTMSKFDFKIELVGCTNFDHNIMVSVNGYKAGEEAVWNSQDIYSFDGQLPANSINEGTNNELRVARIGTNPSDGVDTDSYPYQVYINWFEIGYFRELLAVNDLLEFSAPEPKNKEALFTAELSFIDLLDRGRIPPALRLRFSSKRVTVSETAVVSIQEKSMRWLIIDGRQTYLVIRSGNSLAVYDNEINSYNVAGFLNRDIEVFQLSNSNAIGKFKDAVIKDYKLTPEDKSRIRKYNETGKIPEVGYYVNFEDDGGQDFQYIAVTSSSILKPDWIERNSSSDLRNPSNQADYIIISHPMFMDSAKRLSDWRSSKSGGGFRTTVVDVTDIYDEFGSGMVSPHAIKDFIRYAYQNWADPAPSYVLIFADATYDFLGINEKFYKEAPELIGFIPTFYIWSTFGQTAVDHWYSTISGDDGFPDIYLGRIPVEDVSQAEDVIDKIIANESGKFNGPWRKQIISIADDDTHAAGDELFQIGLEDVWKSHTPVGYDTTKIYLKELVKQVEESSIRGKIPADIAEEMIIESFAKGAVIAQYSGHGGRHVWAHEIMFSITDIESMRETDIYPFLLVLSCYNGYFDIPGELCMAEGLLRARRRGVVAMLSATRLTYGTGNVALNNLLFDGIFKDKLLRLGQVTAISKTRLLIEEGITWLPQMQEYTLFGDPASRLNLPEYEARPQLDNATVSAGDKLNIIPGQLFSTTNGQLPFDAKAKEQKGTFNGNMNVSLYLPDGSSISENLSVANGNYSSLSYSIPNGMTAGMGEIRVFGQNASEAVVGGARISINEPFFVSIKHELNGKNFQIFAQISDDVKPSNLKSVNFNWIVDKAQSWSKIPMVYNQQKDTYSLSPLLQLPAQANMLTYYITAEDLDAFSISSEQQNLKLVSKPNFLISDQNEKNIYTYDTELHEFGINVSLINNGATDNIGTLRIAIFEGNPDENNDEVVDSSAKKIGEGELASESWVLSDNQDITDIFIKCPLSTGRHMVSIWADPDFGDDKPDILGDYDESNENDNLYFKVLNISHFLLRPGQIALMGSIDNVIQASVPAGAVEQDKLIIIDQLSDISITYQPDISFAALPGGQPTAYSLGPSVERFGNPVLLQMKFDLVSFMDIIKKDIGYGDISESQMNAEQREILEKALKDRSSELGIYMWHDSAKKWARLPSQVLLDDNGNILRRIHAVLLEKSYSNGTISEITVDKNTPLDEWTVNFLDSQRFTLSGKKTGLITRNNEPYTGMPGKEYYDEVTGIRLTITERNFTTGDQFKFKTVEVGIVQSETEWYGIMTLMLSKDNRPPNIQIDVSNQNFADGDIISDQPTINALISDSNGVNTLSNKLVISISMDSEDFEPIEDYIVNSAYGTNDITANYSPPRLEPGKYEIKVQAYDFNGNLGMRTVKFEVRKEFELVKGSLMNYPNPFERETDITFNLTSAAEMATVKIYTVSGRLIRILEKPFAINFTVIHWDGRDEDGKEVANGVYYYKVSLKQEDKNIVEMGKMMKLK